MVGPSSWCHWRKTSNTTFLLTHKDMFISLLHDRRHECASGAQSCVCRRAVEGRGGADAVARAGAAGAGRAQRQRPHAHPWPEPAAHQPASEAAGRSRAGRARARRAAGCTSGWRRTGAAAMLARQVLQGVDQHRPRAGARSASRGGAAAPSGRKPRRRTSKPHAAEWDSIRALHVAEADVEAAVSSALGPGPFDLLVDLGTGTGRMLELFAPRYRRGLGLDLSPAMLAYARAKLERAGLTHAQVRQGDIYDLPLADQTADAVVMHQVLALPERPAARRARGRARAGAGRAPADRRFRAARAGVPARAVRARAPGFRPGAGARSGWRTAALPLGDAGELPPPGDGRRQAHRVAVACCPAGGAAAAATDDSARNLERIS